jgi:hypothetical protein
MIIAIGVVTYLMVGCAMIGLAEESDDTKNWSEHLCVLVWPLFVPIGFVLFVINRLPRGSRGKK